MWALLAIVKSDVSRFKKAMFVNCLKRFSSMFNNDVCQLLKASFADVFDDFLCMFTYMLMIACYLFVIFQ
jgi:hypothetical protein